MNWGAVCRPVGRIVHRPEANGVITIGQRVIAIIVIRNATQYKNRVPITRRGGPGLDLPTLTITAYERRFGTHRVAMLQEIETQIGGVARYAVTVVMPRITRSPQWRRI